MSGRKNSGTLFAFVLSVGLLSSSAAALLTAERHSRTQFELLGGVCRQIVDQLPEAEKAVWAALKDYKSNPAEFLDRNIPSEETNYLLSYGYRRQDFQIPLQNYSIFLAAAGLLTGGVLFYSVFLYRRRREKRRIEALTEYLENVNNGGAGLLLQEEEDDFSKLRDEIYKTVSFACQTRDAALRAKQNYADNLSNIAHQLKTPITAISLSAQMISQTAREPSVKRHSAQIQRQLERFAHLEEALLLLSRIDSGTLPLELREIDVFTVLTLAAENLEEVSSSSGVSVDIPELEGVRMKGDLEWTMEALMNILKNCIEHTPEGGTVHCSFEQNPLYTQIQIWDEGEGFAKEDLPRLFERFYRGQRGKEGGIGIGLALSKSILESENGNVSAKNLPEGGACFEIRIYSS